MVRKTGEQVNRASKKRAVIYERDGGERCNLFGLGYDWIQFWAAEIEALFRPNGFGQFFGHCVHFLAIKTEMKKKPCRKYLIERV